MSAMGQLSNDFKVTARTAPEVVEGVNLVLARLQRAGLKFRGRKIGIEGLVGSVLLEFLGKDYETQAALVVSRLPELEAMTGYAADDDPAPPSPTAMIPVAVRDETAMHKRMLDEARGKRPKGKPKK